MRKIKAFIAGLLLTSVLMPMPAYAQSTVTVIGPAPVPGNCVQWFSTTQIKDPGITCNGGAGTSPGGSSGQVQYNNAGTFGGLTNAQLTALINPAGSNGQVQYNNSGAFGGGPININSTNVGIGTTTPASQFDIEGVNAVYFNTAGGSHPTIFQIAVGSTPNPITSVAPTNAFVKHEAITTDTEGGQNAVLYLESKGNNTSSAGVIAQVNTLTALATQTGSGDVVAGYFNSSQAGSPLGTSKSYTSFGVFALGTASGNANNQAIAINPVVSNGTGSDLPLSGYAPGGYGGGTSGIFIQGIGSNLNSAGIYMLAASPSQFDVGLYIAPGTVKTSAIKTTGFSVDPSGNTLISSNSALALTITGSRTADFGISFSIVNSIVGGSNWVFASDGGTITGVGNFVMYNATTAIAAAWLTSTGKLNTVTGYGVNGVAGVACSGSPTSSFTAVGGIVTHC